MNIENKNEESEQTAELTLIKTVKINDQLELNFYKENEKNFIGISHFKFEEELLLKEETAHKIVEVLTLMEQEKKINSKLSSFVVKKEE